MSAGSEKREGVRREGVEEVQGGRKGVQGVSERSRRVSECVYSLLMLYRSLARSPALYAYVCVRRVWIAWKLLKGGAIASGNTGVGNFSLTASELQRVAANTGMQVIARSMYMRMSTH